MSGGVRDPEVLRQRLIATLKQRKQDKGLQLAHTQSTTDIEDGEIIETSNFTQGDQAKPSKAQLPAIAPDPHEARNMVRFLHSKGLRYQDFLAQGLSADFIKQAYTDLGLTDIVSTRHGRTRKPIRRGKAPSVKRQMVPTFSTTTTRVHGQDQQPPGSGTPTPPWMHVTAENGHKRFSSSTTASTLAQKRQKRSLGLTQHPSLVIDFDDSDGTDDEQYDTTQPHKVLHVAKAESSSRLQQMEADIAATMTLINKAQDLQNARKTQPIRAYDSSLPSTASALDDSDRLSIERGLIDSNNDSRRAQTGQLNQLQHELIENENTTTAKTEALSQLDNEEAKIRCLAEDTQVRQDKDIEMIESIETSITRLQEQLLSAKQSLAETVLSNQKLQRQVAAIETSRALMQEQIAKLHLRRAILRPQIQAIQQALVRPVATDFDEGAAQQTDSRNTASKSTSVDTFKHKIDAVRHQLRNATTGADTGAAGIPSFSSPCDTPRAEKAYQGSMRGTMTQAKISSTVEVDMNNMSSGCSRSASTTEDSVCGDDVHSARQIQSLSACSTETSLATSSNISETGPEHIGALQLEVKTMEAGPHAQTHLDHRSSTPIFHNSLVTNLEHNSPLARFKVFKLHKLYPDVIECGYRSNRYFNKLRADAMLCKFETQGGICSQDSQCPDTHFNAINMTDDEILIELSSYNVGVTKKG